LKADDTVERSGDMIDCSLGKDNVEQITSSVLTREIYFKKLTVFLFFMLFK